MEVLAEESEEETSSRIQRNELQEMDTEEEEEDRFSDDSFGDGGIKRKEPNQFDSLCDGVLNAVALVHAALADLLTLKDELITHMLPPNVLTSVTMVSTKLYRSVGDLDMPMTELIRLVRLYSTPWEQKSTALKKLHQDYESKKSQVNIAIKKLQMIDGQAKRIAHERRIMNWEKLFAKMTQAKGHGRRWKFMIENFKKHATQGADHLQQYMNTLQEKDTGEEDEEAEEPTASEPEDATRASDNEATDGDESETESSKGVKDSEMTSEVSSMRAHVYIKPPTRDAETWTHEPQYDRYLNVRVHKPEDLDARELRCSVTFRGTTYKTDVLDPLPAEEEESPKVPTPPPKDEDEEGESEDKPKAKPKRGRGLIGRRGGGAVGGGAAKPISISSSGAVDAAVEKKKPSESRYEEFMFEVPEDEPFVPRSQQTSGADELKVAVHVGPRKQLYAMATIGMDDFESLDLPVVLRKPPEGDYFDTEAEPANKKPTRRRQTLRQSSVTSTDEEYFAERDRVLEEVDKVGFPLYPLQSKISSESDPIGSVPLLFYWTRRLKPRVFNRLTESETVTEIVYDMTGFDMNEVTKADLHKETQEEALSAICFTPEQDQEPMVPQSEYTKLLEASNEEIALLQEEYERRLQELTESFHQMQENYAHDHQLTRQDRIALSAGSQSTMSRTPSRHEVVFNDEQDVIRIHASDRARKPRRPAPPPDYTSSLPKAFLERLKFFENESYKRKQELAARVNEEVREQLEKSMAGQHRIAPEMQQDPVTAALQDVSLPAVFLPNKSNNLTIFNPRASKYFHAKGSDGARLTQPPSMLQLPPLPKDKIPVVNLFDMSKNFQKGTQDWLIRRYLMQQDPQLAAKHHDDMLGGEGGDGAEREISPEETGVPHPSLATTPGMLMKTRENTLLAQEKTMSPRIEKIAEAV